MIPDGRASRVDQEGGLLTIDRKVIKAIILQEASQVPGVLELGGDSLLKRIFRWLGLPYFRGGLTLEVGDGEVAMNIDLVARYGVSIPELAREVRQRVKRAVKVMTGCDVRVVNVRIRSIKGGRRAYRLPADDPDRALPPPELGLGDLETGEEPRFRF